MQMSRQALKAMIELAKDTETADTVIQDATGYKDAREKLAFLQGMFDVSIIGRTGKTDDEQTDYIAVLSTIVNAKWRA